MSERLRDYAGDNSAFYYWLLAVDAAVVARADVGVLDLPDFLLRDAFDNGDSAESVAAQVLEAAS